MATATDKVDAKATSRLSQYVRVRTASRRQVKDRKGTSSEEGRRDFRCSTCDTRGMRMLAMSETTALGMDTAVLLASRSCTERMANCATANVVAEKSLNG